jgi:glycosyl transferase family 2
MEFDMPNNIAAVTMVYNEPVMLPLWANYYSRNLGASACYVVDHGSTDGSTDNLDVNVLRIPRSPMNNQKRTRFLSRFCSSLLKWYDTVMYTDADEFLVPDPADYPSLRDFCQKTENPVTTAIGLDVQHNPDLEGPLSPEIPVLRQRRWVRFNFALCKPSLTSVPIEWTPGFHSSDQPTMFDRLFMFHLHNYDLDTAMQRLSKTRDMPWEDARLDNHQRWSDQRYREMILAIAELPRMEGATFESGDPHIARYTQWITKFVKENPDKRDHFYHDNGIACNELLRVPDRFLDSI